MLKKLIIVDDDTPFRERLGRSMEKKGFFVETFASYEENDELFSDRNVFPKGCIKKMEKILI